jgi:hypothetical protein
MNMKYQLLIIVLLGLALRIVVAGATNISGTWACVIDQKDDDGPMTVTFVIKQDGEKLTGAYSDAVTRNAPITGTVKGNKVMLSYELNPPAESKKTLGLTVNFTGAIESPTKMTGAVGRPYCNDCKWTATKKK